MSGVPAYAVVPSGGRGCLHDCVDSLLPQVDLLYLVQTRRFRLTPRPGLVCLPQWRNAGLNISRWWNAGIRAAARAAARAGEAAGTDGGGWDVLVANDDIIAPPGLVAGLSAGMRSDLYALAYCHPPAAGTTTISGWCFMLRGEAGLLADERLKWWYGDDDLEYQARAKGGSISVPGCTVQHLYPGGNDEGMEAQIVADAEYFRAKWSRL